MMMVKADSFQTTGYSIMESGLHERQGTISVCAEFISIYTNSSVLSGYLCGL